MAYAVLSKFAINVGLAIYYARHGVYPMVLMFLGVSIADLGTLWVCWKAKF